MITYCCDSDLTFCARKSGLEKLALSIMNWSLYIVTNDCSNDKFLPLHVFRSSLILIRSIANISKNRPNLIDNYIPLIVSDTTSVVEENMTKKNTSPTLSLLNRCFKSKYIQTETVRVSPFSGLSSFKTWRPHV